jgi:Mannosyltransferase (PIG-V)
LAHSAVDLATDRDLLAFLAIRCGIWVFTAFALLWAPLHDELATPRFRVHDGLTDRVFGTFAQWDSGWYLHIADAGYDSREATAFFPFYPVVVAAARNVTQSTIVAAVLVSLAAGAVAVHVLKRIGAEALDHIGQRDAILLLALFPIGYVFTAPYSDALFLAFASSSFLAAQRRHSLLAGVFGCLAVATRLIGLALVPALIILLWPRPWTRPAAARLAPILLVPLGLAAYAMYLESRFDNPIVFLDALGGPEWNHGVAVAGPLSGMSRGAEEAWHSSVAIGSNLASAPGAAGYAQVDVWNVTHFALLVAAIALTYVAWRRFGSAFGIYSTGVLLIALSAPAGLIPLNGLPRYLLTDFPLFFALAFVVRHRPLSRVAVLALFAATSVVVALAFSSGIWIA